MFPMYSDNSGNPGYPAFWNGGFPLFNQHLTQLSHPSFFPIYDSRNLGKLGINKQTLEEMQKDAGLQSAERRKPQKRMKRQNVGSQDEPAFKFVKKEVAGSEEEISLEQRRKLQNSFKIRIVGRQDAKKTEEPTQLEQEVPLNLDNSPGAIRVPVTGFVQKTPQSDTFAQHVMAADRILTEFRASSHQLDDVPSALVYLSEMIQFAAKEERQRMMCIDAVEKFSRMVSNWIQNRLCTKLSETQAAFNKIDVELKASIAQHMSNIY